MEQNKSNTSKNKVVKMGGPMGRPMSGEKPKNFKKSIGSLIKYMKPYVLTLVISFIFAIVGAFLNVYGPKKLTVLTTMLSTGNFVMDKVISVSLVIMLIIATCVLMQILQNWILSGVNASLCKKLRSEISEKTNRLPLSYFDKNTYGDVLSRITNDVDTISFNLNSSITSLITSIVTLICVPIFMFTISWELTLIALLSIPVTILLVFIVVAISQKYFVTQQKALGEVNGQIEEVYSAQTIVKVFNAQNRENAKFDAINSKLCKSSYKSQFISGTLHPIMNLVTNISYILCCVVSAVLIITGRYPLAVFIGEIPIFLTYIRQFNNPLQQLSTISTNLQSTAAAAERVFEFLNEPEQLDESNKTNKLENFKGNVEFKNVKFGYNPDKIIIKDLSFAAKAGQKIAIVGPTGAGKTTIVNLLMRFYECNSGQILVDGQNIADLKREDVRALFAMVLQDTWLFDGTIRDNLKYGNPNATEESIIEACKASNIWHFITTLPNGLDYVLDEKASLSQGERQLFTIARAMIQNSPMLILDEATSSVDTRTEQLIQQAMDNLSKGKTSFVIAHRLSTIKNADLILLLKDGDVIEQGTHLELMKLNGEYSKLYNSQFTLDYFTEEE